MTEDHNGERYLTIEFRESDLDAFGEIRQAIVYQALGRVKTLLTGKDTKQTLQKSSLDNN